MGDVGGDHGLAGSLSADQHGVGALVDEVEGHEACDGLGVDGAGPRPVEVGQGREGGDVGGGAAAFEAARGALEFFTGDEVGEPVFVGDLVPAGDEAMESEGAGAVLEGGHVSSPLRVGS